MPVTSLRAINVPLPGWDQRLGRLIIPVIPALLGGHVRIDRVPDHGIGPPRRRLSAPPTHDAVPARKNFGACGECRAGWGKPQVGVDTIPRQEDARIVRRGNRPRADEGMFMRTLLLRVILAIAASAALVVTHSRHQRARRLPGPNGRSAFSRYDPAFGDDASYIMNPGGSNVRALFPSFASNHATLIAGRRRGRGLSGLGITCLASS
jgi:hypothetical protein